MKEVTEWDNNPREMWVWDNKPERKVREFVIWVRQDDHHPRVICVNKKDHDSLFLYQHCAEIERCRMTNKQLARWLAQSPTRELQSKGSTDDSSIVSHCFTYTLSEEDKEVTDNVYVREGDSPWFVPFMEEE